MVLTAALGSRRLPTTLLTLTVLTPFLTGDDTLRLGATCVENYWVLSLASLRARRYASDRLKQCVAEAADQQEDSEKDGQGEKPEPQLVPARLSDNAGDNKQNAKPRTQQTVEQKSVTSCGRSETGTLHKTEAGANVQEKSGSSMPKCNKLTGTTSSFSSSKTMAGLEM